jgi:hypothetical protein
VADGCDQELNVVIVDTGESVPEIDGYPVGQACRDPQHSLLAAGAGQAGPQGGDRGGPVDGGHRPPASRAAVDVDELAGEVGSVQPGLGDEELGGGFSAAEALGVGAQRGGQCGG